MNTKTLDGIVISLDHEDFHITQPPNRLYTSFSSQYLPHYINGLVDPSTFDTDQSLGEGMNPEYLNNYRRFLSSRHVHLGTLFQAGFCNPRYDITFCFTTDRIFSGIYRVGDHDCLAQALMYGTNHPLDTIFKNPADYEEGDEIIVPRLDLKQATEILVYSPEATKKIIELPHFSHIPISDLTEVRQKATELLFK